MYMIISVSEGGPQEQVGLQQKLIDEGKQMKTRK